MSNKGLATQYFDAVWSEHYDPAKIRELTAPELVFRYPMHGEFHGAEAVIEILDSFRESLPDLKFWATDELLEDGDYVIARWEGGGTHTGKAITEIPHGGPIPAGSGQKIFFSGHRGRRARRSHRRPPATWRRRRQRTLSLSCTEVTARFRLPLSIHALSFAPTAEVGRVRLKR
jgi:predicted ester cyclase